MRLLSLLVASTFLLHARCLKTKAGAGVPKIIHQTIRSHSTVQNPIWKASGEAWRTHFPEGSGPDLYHYMLWSHDDIRPFFHEHCEPAVGPLPPYRDKIMISDLGRYCFLWKYGGIYADMDYEPRANFYDRLAPDRVSIVQSPYKEIVQNSLMASPAGMPFWLHAMQAAMVEAKRPEKAFSVDTLMEATPELAGLVQGGGPSAVLPYQMMTSLLQEQVAGLTSAYKAGWFNENEMVLSGPKLLSGLPELSDPSIVQVLPCRDFQRATHYEAEDATKNCGRLNATSAREVLGIHWGTWSYEDPALRRGAALGGASMNGETNALFLQLFPELHPGQALPDAATLR